MGSSGLLSNVTSCYGISPDFDRRVERRRADVDGVFLDRLERGREHRDRDRYGDDRAHQRPEADRRAGEQLLPAHRRLRGSRVGSCRRGFAGRGALLVILGGRVRHESYLRPIAQGALQPIRRHTATLRRLSRTRRRGASRRQMPAAPRRPAAAARMAEASGVMGRSARRSSEVPRATASAPAAPPRARRLRARCATRRRAPRA